ncbi:MAG: DUF4404 family protein [Steroidobacteraceae bacterium]
MSDDETLRQLLARVHERLNRTGTVDPDAREMLATIMRDIDATLGRGTAGAPGVADSSAASAKAAAAPRLEALAVRFEAEHPTIAQLLRQIADVLGQAGV